MFGTNTEPSAGNDGRLSRDFPELPVSAETNREKGDGIYDELVGTFLPKATKEVGPSIDVSGELVRCRHSPDPPLLIIEVVMCGPGVRRSSCHPQAEVRSCGIKSQLIARRQSRCLQFRAVINREMGEIPARRQKYDRQGSYEYLSNFVEQMSTSASTCVRLRIFHFGAAAAAGRVHPHIISQLPETSGPTPNFFNYQTSIIIPGAIILARYQNVPTTAHVAIVQSAATQEVQCRWRNADISAPVSKNSSVQTPLIPVHWYSWSGGGVACEYPMKRSIAPRPFRLGRFTFQKFVVTFAPASISPSHLCHPLVASSLQNRTRESANDTSTPPPLSTSGAATSTHLIKTLIRKFRCPDLNLHPINMAICMTTPFRVRFRRPFFDQCERESDTGGVQQWWRR
ncbi:hypothetical protein GEV33_013047 [Tenebrio molitor]|uniref:Uncharacterized protein n=1 Tax=Tenebrio molitor TaxID=7067 RepID=A0A8J6H7Z4_TENMO|nr:hypothetical protein GEV33_013047 [Tenebrio molitor]